MIRYGISCRHLSTAAHLLHAYVSAIATPLHILRIDSVVPIEELTSNSICYYSLLCSLVQVLIYDSIRYFIIII